MNGPPCAWRAALYIRLSREDGSDESYSVQNQRQRLTEFIESLPPGEVASPPGVYIDDGKTGTDSDREGFLRMLRDIERGEINCVVVKDLSRLSRNDWECKWYLQQLFVVKDVRFISLELPRLDSFKNPDGVYELGVSIQSLYNENHCRETSLKVRGTFDMKRRKGEFIGAFAPYGYLKDPRDRGCFIVDEEAAATVRDIFFWFTEGGLSRAAIVKKLTASGVPCPTAHKKQLGMKYFNPSAAPGGPLWSERSVTAILSNRAYLGHMVQGRQRVKSYKVHARVPVPESDWFVVEDTHEAIVCKETFEKARALLESRVRSVAQKEAVHVFSGLLRCADCGKAMVRRTARGRAYYACRAYVSAGLCSRHSIRHDRLERAVLGALQAQIALADGERLIREVENAPVQNAAAERRLCAKRRAEREREKAAFLRSGLYEDWKEGDLTREEYLRLREELSEREKRSASALAALEREAPEAGAEPCFEAFKEHKNVTELTRGLAVALVKNILVHEAGDITVEFAFPKVERPG